MNTPKLADRTMGVSPIPKFYEEQELSKQFQRKKNQNFKVDIGNDFP